jgi:peptide deformylase
MIIKAPNPLLKTNCTKVTYGQGAQNISKLLLKEFAEAFEEQKAHGNRVVGLAAPQIGITKQAFTAFGLVFINPHLVSHSDQLITSVEGCLSLDSDAHIKRKRYKSVKLIWFDVARKLHTNEFKGDEAVIIQHEMDHLRGVVIS